MCLAELNIPDGDSGGASGLHARVPRPVPPSAPAPTTLNPNVGLTVWDLEVADRSTTNGGAISGVGPKAEMDRGPNRAGKATLFLAPSTPRSLAIDPAVVDALLGEGPVLRSSSISDRPRLAIRRFLA